jgi:hypothetical protein
MDKSRKLRRYRRKDYSQVVEFPVEIIGRDGVVRRYSFEESVRLYQRRIASADIRYKDNEVSTAERDHCQHRIDQLRRSYFARFGWPEIGLVDGPDEADGRMSGEVAAFLRRCLANDYPDLAALCITFLESRAHHRVYHLLPPTPITASTPDAAGRFLLYVYRFEKTSTCETRDAFFEFVKVLDGIRDTSADDIEVLIAFHHTSDCGLILTGTRNVVPEIDQEAMIEDLELSWADEIGVGRPVQLEEALVLVRRGLYSDALERFITAYTHQNYNRMAYLGAAAIADLIGHDEEAETAAIMGTRYFPQDPALLFHLSLAHLRRGDSAAARSALQRAGDHANGAAARAMLNGIVSLWDGRISDGTRALRGIRGDAFRTDPHLDRARSYLLAQLKARLLVRRVSRLTGLIGATLATSGPVVSSWGLCIWGAAILTLSVVVHGGIHRAWRRQFREVLTGPREHRLNLTSLSALQWNQPESRLQ